MKIKDITEWSERWATPSGTLDAHAPVADGVLVDLSLWGISIIGLAVQCQDGKYFGSLILFFISVGVINSARNEVRNEAGCGAINPCCNSEE